jgi:hypothetical protein
MKLIKAPDNWKNNNSNVILFLAGSKEVFKKIYHSMKKTWIQKSYEHFRTY